MLIGALITAAIGYYLAARIARDLMPMDEPKGPSGYCDNCGYDLRASPECGEWN